MSEGQIDNIIFWDTGKGAINTGRRFSEEGGFPITHCVIDPQYAPYGDKNDPFIMSRMVSLINYAHNTIPGRSYGIVACNTASTVLEPLKKEGFFDPAKGPLISVIDPILKEATDLAMFGEKDFDPWERKIRSVPDLQSERDASKIHVAIFGTVRTINSNFYQNRLHTALPSAGIRAIGCPNLATLIDGNRPEQEIRKDIWNSVNQCKDLEGEEVIVVLACTHYQQVSGIFEDSFKALGIKTPHILDQPRITSSYAQKELQKRNLRGTPGLPSRLIIHSTGAPEITEAMVRKIFSDQNGYVDGKNIYRLGLNDVTINPIDLPYFDLAGHRNLLMQRRARLESSYLAYAS